MERSERSAAGRAGLRASGGLVRRRAARSTRRGGFSLLELMVVLLIMTIAVGMLTSTMVSAARMGPVQRETAVAAEAARARLEEMRALSFRDLFALYNGDPADDPGGAGSAPGAGFAVPGLEPALGDADGLVGRVNFPEELFALREDFEDEELGMPRDLDGDGEIDAADHALDYLILPVELVLDWKGKSGDQSLRIFTMFTDL